MGESNPTISRIKKRVLIFGAGGFLGRNLLEQLWDKYIFITPTRQECDIEKTIPMTADVDAMINCVLCDDELQAFLNMTHYYTGKFIQIGSGAEYDHTLPIVNVTEDFDRQPKDSYGLGKYYITRHAQLRDKTIVLRPFGIFGKYEDVNRRFISRAILDNLQGDPISIWQNVKLSYVWVNDLVKIIDYFIEHKAKHKVYNISGHQISLVDIARRIGEYKVNDPHMNEEYTCNDTRVRKETKIKYTPFDKSLNKLREYYASDEFKRL